MSNDHDSTDDLAVSSIPLDTEDGGQVVIQQQNVGEPNQVGGGEFKNVRRGPTPDEAEAEQAELQEEMPIATEATCVQRDPSPDHRPAS